LINIEIMKLERTYHNFIKILFLFNAQIETHRFGHKTNDPLINTEDDEKLMLKDGLSLLEQGVEHETEISFFNRDEYLKYKESKSMQS
jgi:hypothetical protein